MRYQANGWSCGPASLQNAFKVLGRHVAQAKIAELCGATEADGVDEQGLIRAALALGFAVDPWGGDEPAKARYWLFDALSHGRPVVLCIQRWSHWVCVIGACGYRYIVAEPARYPHTMRENGVLSLSWERLSRVWRAARRVRGKDGPMFYGIAVSRP